MKAAVPGIAVALVLATGCGPTGLTAVHGELDVATTPINFGNQPVLTPVTQTLLLQNVGRGPLTISSMTLTSQMPAGSSAISISPTSTPVMDSGAQLNLTITFDAPAMGPYSASLVIDSNDPMKPTVSISISGNATTVAVASAMPSCLNFGAVAEGQTSILPVTVSSSGTAPLLITSLALTADTCPAFAPAGSWNTTPPVSVPNPSGSVDVNVAFTPTLQTVTASNQQCNGTLNIGTNDPKQTTIPICLEGTMVQPPVAVAAAPMVVAPGTVVTLDGSGSYDPDDMYKIGSYLWAETGGAAVTLSSDSVESPTVTLSSAGAYAFDLIVTDNSPLMLQSIPSRVTVTAASSMDLLVVLVWDQPVVDLHLHLLPIINGTPSMLFGSADCYGYQPNVTFPGGAGNCVNSGNILSGYGPESDDVTGFGTGSYNYQATVVYATANGASNPDVNATVRFYLYGTLYGEVTKQLTMPGDQANNFVGEVWNAADVAWPTGAINTSPGTSQ